MNAELWDGDKLRESDGLDSWIPARDDCKDGELPCSVIGLFLKPGSSVSSVSVRWSILNDLDVVLFWSCSDGNLACFLELFP